MDMPASPAVSTHCGKLSGVLNIVGDKWTVMIVRVLIDQPRRFNDIKRTIGGISQQMLTRTLKALERDGMVSRTVYPTLPPQVEYALTELGHSLALPLHALGMWAAEHIEEIDGNRLRYDLDKARGGDGKVHPQADDGTGAEKTPPPARLTREASHLPSA